MTGARYHDLHDLSCVVHVHSTYSDGTASLPEIIDAARFAGRSAVMVTDHDTLGAKRDGWEGWHDGVMVMVGVEVSPSGGHYLAFGLDAELDHGQIPESEIPGRVAAAGGFGFAAHPFSQGSKMSKLIGRPHPWRRLADPDLTGIELWSLATDSAESWSSPLEAIRFLRDPESQITDPPQPNLESWDALLARRRTVAIGGLDAHQTGVRIRGRAHSPMPNHQWFRMLGTHLLLDEPPSGDFDADRAAAYRALRAGRCYISRDSLGDPAGFRFWAERDGERIEMGGEARGEGLRFGARLPREAEVTLLRDGAEVARAVAQEIDEEADAPGVYRMTARVRSRGESRTWILSNAIRVVAGDE